MDPSTLIRHPDQPFAFYQEHEKALQLGALRVKLRYLASPARLPDEPSSLVDLIRSMHGALFFRAEPGFAGRLRTHGEDAWFGGEAGARHELKAYAPDLIEASLLAALRRLDVATVGALDKAMLAHRCAVFLEDFFRIHPFRDGNGRIGRLFVELLVLVESKFRTRALGNGRKYRRALEYAHRHAPTSSDPERKVGHANPWYLLASWVEEHLEEPPAEPREEPPSEDGLEDI